MELNRIALSRPRYHSPPKELKPFSTLFKSPTPQLNDKYPRQRSHTPVPEQSRVLNHNHYEWFYLPPNQVHPDSNVTLSGDKRYARDDVARNTLLQGQQAALDSYQSVNRARLRSASPKASSLSAPGLVSSNSPSSSRDRSQSPYPERAVHVPPARKNRLYIPEKFCNPFFPVPPARRINGFCWPFMCLGNREQTPHRPVSPPAQRDTEIIYLLKL